MFGQRQKTPLACGHGHTRSACTNWRIIAEALAFLQGRACQRAMPGAGERDGGSSPLGHAGLLVGSGDTGKGAALDRTEKEMRSPSRCDRDEGDHVLTHPHSRPPARGVCVGCG